MWDKCHHGNWQLIYLIFIMTNNVLEPEYTYIRDCFFYKVNCVVYIKSNHSAGRYLRTNKHDDQQYWILLHVLIVDISCLFIKQISGDAYILQLFMRQKRKAFKYILVVVVFNNGWGLCLQIQRSQILHELLTAN